MDRSRRAPRLSATFAWGGLLTLLAAAPSAGAEFLPAFHQALRSNVQANSLTTYRMKIPIGRSGTQLRISLRAGTNGSLLVSRVNVAHAAGGGNLTATPTAVTFLGQAGFSAAAGQRVTSDIVPFPVTLGDELYLSFEATGDLAASNMMGFPDSFTWTGSVSGQVNPPAGTPWPPATGVDTVEVLGASSRAFVAIGDSITEGYVSGDVGTYQGRADDYRNAWTYVAQVKLDQPMANAAASGQGIEGALTHLQSEIFTLQGITDCVTLIGTNDLAAYDTAKLEQLLTQLYVELKPFCRVWGGTMLPKEPKNDTNLATENQRRQEVNQWIRTQAPVDAVMDFEAAVAVPGNPNAFQPGLGEDGIHPSIQGQAVLGAYVAQQIAAAEAATPDAGTDAGAPPPDAGVDAGTLPDGGKTSPGALGPATPGASSGCTAGGGPAPGVVTGLVLLGAFLSRCGRRRRKCER